MLSSILHQCPLLIDLNLSIKHKDRSSVGCGEQYGGVVVGNFASHLWDQGWSLHVVPMLLLLCVCRGGGGPLGIVVSPHSPKND